MDGTHSHNARATPEGKSDIEAALHAVTNRVAHACFQRQCNALNAAVAVECLATLLGTPEAEGQGAPGRASHGQPGSHVMGFRPLPGSFDCIMERIVHLAKTFRARRAICLLCSFTKMAHGGYWTYDTLADRLAARVVVGINTTKGENVAALLVACAKAAQISYWVHIQPHGTCMRDYCLWCGVVCHWQSAARLMSVVLKRAQVHPQSRQFHCCVNIP